MIYLVLQSVALAPVQGTWLCAAAMFPTALARRRRRAYASDIPEKEGRGFGDLNNESAQTAQSGSFTCVLTFVRSQGAAVAGIPSGMPVSFRAGSPTLPLAAHPFGDGRGSTATKEYYTMPGTTTPIPSSTLDKLAYDTACECANEGLNHRADDVSPHVLPIASGGIQSGAMRRYRLRYGPRPGRIGRIRDMNAEVQPLQPSAPAHQPEQEAVHRPFSWLPNEGKHDQVAQFMALTMDVCNGIQTCLELVHSGDLTRRLNEDADLGEEVAPTLGRLDRERLLLLATASVRMLAGDAERQIIQANKEQMGGGA